MFYQTKRNILNIQESEVKNPISVNQTSIDSPEVCTLHKISGKKYSCTVSIKNLNNLFGKDFMFSLEKIPADTDLKNIELQFNKSTNWENFTLFLQNFKRKVFERFI